MFNSTAFLPAPPSLGVASCWSSLLALTPLSHRSLFTLLMFSANLFVFWIPATLQYIYLKKLAPWKINKDDPPDQLMKDCIKRTTVNTLVTNQVFMYWVLYVQERCEWRQRRDENEPDASLASLRDASIASLRDASLRDAIYETRDARR